MNLRDLLIIPLTLLIAACEKNTEQPTNDYYPISLMADITAVNTTRADDNNQNSESVSNIVYKGTSAVGMTAGVWFSTTIGEYPDGGTTPMPPFLPYHATVTYLNNVPTTVYIDPGQKNNPISYPLPDNTNPTKPLDVYSVGLYPADGWKLVDDAKSVTHSIDGKTDVMFAEQIKGSWGNPFSSQTYKHLLTWLKFEARATDEEAIEQWGNIKKISVISSDDTIKITFPQTEGGSSTFAFINSDGKDNEIIAKEGSFPLSVTTQNFGELLCPPSATIKLCVESEKIGTKEVLVTLNNEQGTPIINKEDTIGKLFIINLYFNKFNNIDGSCSLVPMTEQNVDLSGN